MSGVVGTPIGGLRRLLLAPLDVVQRFLKLSAGDGVTEILLYTGSEQEVPALTAALAEALPDRDPGLAVQAWTETNELFSTLQLSTWVFNIIALFFFLLATTAIVNTTMMVVFERTKEIGTIAALGMTAAQISRLFFLESLFIGIAAALAGVALGSAIVLPLSQAGIDYSAAMEGVELNLSDVLYPRLNARSTVLVFCYAIAVTAAASYWPARKASRLHPAVALRGALSR